MAGLTRKEMKHDEFLETATEAGHWLEEHWKLVGAIFAVALVLLVTVLGWREWSKSRTVDLRERLAIAQSTYVAIAPDVSDAEQQLTVSLAEFRDLADDAGSRPEGAVARFYVGRILLRQDQPAEAIPELRAAVADAPDNLFRQNARVALARGLAGTGELAQADELLRTVANDESSVFPPAQGLMTLAALYRDAGDAEKADEVLQEVVERFPDTQAGQRARAELGQ